jgi:hypothetical protein
MDEAALSRLLLKIAGLVIIVFAIASAPDYVVRALSARATEGSLTGYILLGVLPVLVPLALGALLFTFPADIVRRSTGLPASTSPDTAAAEKLAYVILGAYLLSQAIVDGAYLLGKLRLYTIYIEGHGYASDRTSPALPDDFARICGSVAEFILAWVLILGASGLTALRRKVVGLPST